MIAAVRIVVQTYRTGVGTLSDVSPVSEKKLIGLRGSIRLDPTGLSLLGGVKIVGSALALNAAVMRVSVIESALRITGPRMLIVPLTENRRRKSELLTLANGARRTRRVFARVNSKGVLTSFAVLFPARIGIGC